ncbi:hypothetical protein YC2023_078543 [Brassica napus]
MDRPGIQIRLSDVLDLKTFYAETGFQVPIVGFMCSSIGAYIVVKVLKLKPPVSFVFCINIVLVAGDWRKYLDWRIWASLVTDHSMSGSSKKTLPDNISAPNLRLEARLGVEKRIRQTFIVNRRSDRTMLMLQDISGMKRFSSYSAPKRAASERSFPCGDDRFNLRPTSENIQKLRYQLANPRFGEHHLFFLQSVGRILRLARGCTASSGLLHYVLNRRLMLKSVTFSCI